MPTSAFFSATYGEARDKFLEAARAAGARMAAYCLPDHRGPQGELLTTDVAILGPDEPDSVLVLISATHGVEGFGGSGCQVGYLSDQLFGALPPRSRTILIHALNPYGFAWLRRVNEVNIDLNRNFQNFTKPLPDSSPYEAIHDWLVPEDWDGAARRGADAALQQEIGQRGMRAFLAALSGGQYIRPTGLFYGGTKESWSNTTLRRILSEHLAPSARQVAVLDFHTGLGPTGYGEPIYGGSSREGAERARKWYGCELTSFGEDNSTSAVVSGSLEHAFLDLPDTVQAVPLALEFGTRPILQVLTALRADHWLHAVADRQTPLREGITRQIRDAFYVDTPAWKAAVYGRAADFVLRASRGLASS